MKEKETTMYVESMPISDNESSSGTTESECSLAEVKTRIPCSTDLAVLVRHRANLSISQTLKVFETLYIELSDDRMKPPSRSGLLKGSDNFSSKCSEILENNTLQFDGKTYMNLYGKEKIELIAICFGEKLLGIKEIPNKKAETIFNTIFDVLDKNKLRPDVVISDTEATNTGVNNGVVSRLKRCFPDLIYKPCVLHILDLLLKHEFSARFINKSTSPNISYEFVQNLQKNWTNEKDKYLAKCTEPEVNESINLPATEHRRRDYQLLLKLVKAVKFLRENRVWSYISCLPNTAPSISNARWNSRAIFALFAELCGMDNENILSINTFIIEVIYS